MIKKLYDKILQVAVEDSRGHYDVDGVSQYPDHTVIVASAAQPGHTYQSCLDHYVLHIKQPRSTIRMPANDIRIL